MSIQDWQGDGDQSKVTIEAPELMPEPVEATWNGEIFTPKFSCAIDNGLHANPDNYQALICVRDALNSQPDDGLATFELATIEVSSSTPTVVGIEISPTAPALEDKDSTFQFSAYAKFADGSLSPITDNVQWTATATDLNGNALVEIDSTGFAKRLTCKWWGGTATIHAKYQGFICDAIAFCPDPFADSATVDFGKFVEPGGTYSKIKSLLGPPVGGKLWREERIYALSATAVSRH